MKALFLLFYNFIDDHFHSKRIKNYLRENIFFKKPIIFDIGAHKGKMTKIFFQIYQNSKIYCFEANKLLIKDLNNINESNLVIKNLAVGNENQKKILDINELDLTSSLTTINQNSLYLKLKRLITENKKKKLSHEVQEITLDSFCKIEHISEIDLIKVDCEGYEYQVLCGAKTIIKKTKYLIIEIQKNNMYKNYSAQKIENFLKENNFMLLKKFSFPFMFFQDRIYKNNDFS